MCSSDLICNLINNNTNLNEKDKFLITAETKKTNATEINEALADINSLKKRIVIYNTCIQNGVSNTTNHYNKLIAIKENFGINGNDALNAVARFRTITDTELYHLDNVINIKEITDKVNYKNIKKIIEDRKIANFGHRSRQWVLLYTRR